MGRRQQIKWGAFLSYGMIAFNIIVGLLYTPWMVGCIGKSGYGLYSLVTTFLSYFVVDFGLWMAVNKIISRLRAENNAEEEKKVLGVTARIYLGLDLLVLATVITVFFFIDNIFIKLTPEELVHFKVVYIIAALFSVLSFPFGFIKGVYNAHEYYIEGKLFDLAVRLGIILFTVIVLMLGGGLYALVFCYGLVPFLVNIGRVAYLSYRGIRADIKAWNGTTAKEIFSVSGWLFLVVLAELFINNISPTLIATFSGTSEIAVFSIGLVIYSYVYHFASSIAGLFLPKVTELHVQGREEDIHLLARKVGRIQLFITGFVALGVILVGKDFFAAWMGPDFSRSYFVSVMLIVPQVLIFLRQIESSYLLAADKIRYQSYCMILTAISSVISSIILIPQMGAIGSAIGISCSNFIFMFMGTNYIYYKYLHFSLFSFLKSIGPIIIGFLMVSGAFFLLIYHIENIIPQNDWMRLIVKICILGIIYLCSLPFIMNVEEKNMSKQIIKKIIHVNHH